MCVGKREVKALRVKCDNVERGCKWEGTVDTLEEHVATCRFTQCKQNNMILVKLQSVTHTTEKLQSVMTTMKRENAAMAYKLQSATDTTVKLKKENEDMAIKLHSVMNTIASLRGKLITFKVTEFGKKKANNEVFYSESFYSTCGYNISIAVYPNGHGDGKGTHVTLFAHVVEGDYDNQLQWPFIGTVKVELLNQLEDKNHNYATLPFYEEDNTRVVGHNGFISHSQLSNIPQKSEHAYSDTYPSLLYSHDHTLCKICTPQLPPPVILYYHNNVNNPSHWYHSHCLYPFCIHPLLLTLS